MNKDKIREALVDCIQVLDGEGLDYTASEARQALAELDTDDWIKVTPETMPPSSTALDTVDVWAYYKHDFPNSEWKQGKCRYFGRFDYWRSNDSPSDIIVTHWQPLPANPKD